MLTADGSLITADGFSGSLPPASTVLDNVGKVINEARVLLQDTVEPYRYPTTELVEALNIGVLEARRLRPELFVGAPYMMSSYSALGDAFSIDPMYRPSFIYYVAGRAQLRDDEPSQDQRATVLMNKFIAQLLSITA